MNVFEDGAELFKFSLSWLKSKEGQMLFLKLSLINMGLAVLMLLSTSMMLGGLVLPFLGAGIAEKITSLGMGGSFALLGGLGILGFLLGFALFLLSLLVAVYYNTMPMFLALRSKGFQNVSWSFYKALCYVWLCLVQFFAECFSLYNKKFIPLVLAFYAFVILAIVALITHSGILILLFGLIAVLLALPYYLLIVYNWTRLYVTQAVYLSENLSTSKALEKAWSVTKSMPIELFIIIVGITIFWSFFGSMINAVLEVLINRSFQAGGLGIGLGFFFLILYLSVIFFTNVFSFFVFSHLVVGVYDKLVKQSKVSPTATVPRSNATDAKKPAARRKPSSKK